MLLRGWIKAELFDWFYSKMKNILTFIVFSRLFTCGANSYKTAIHRFSFNTEFFGSSEKMSPSTAAFHWFSFLLIFYTGRVLKIRKTSDSLACFDEQFVDSSPTGSIYQHVCVLGRLYGYHIFIYLHHIAGSQNPQENKQ